MTLATANLMSILVLLVGVGLVVGAFWWSAGYMRRRMDEITREVVDGWPEGLVKDIEMGEWTNGKRGQV